MTKNNKDCDYCEEVLKPEGKQLCRGGCELCEEADLAEKDLVEMIGEIDCQS